MDLPPALPAKFSVRIGSGTGQAAPAKYCAVDPLPGIKYFGRDVSCANPCRPECRFSTTHASVPADGLNSNFMDDAGRLQISGIASASSAAAGWVAMTPILKELPDLSGSSLTPWVCTEREGKAFSEASKLVKQVPVPFSDQALHAVADKAVHGLVDAGITEGTGIAQAVAEGATDIVAFMNLASGNDFDSPSYLLKLFKGDRGGVCGLPVFQSPSKDVVDAAYSGKGAHGFKQLPGQMHLKGIRIGTISCVTADNMWLGISSGTSVRLHVVAVGTDLGIIGAPARGAQSFEPWNHYDELVQEIVDCVTAADEDTRNVVQSVLLPMILGAA